MQFTISRDILNLLIKVTSQVNDNPEESDFFTVKNCKPSELKNLLDLFINLQNKSSPKDETISFNIDIRMNYIFDGILWYGVNFGDDIPELEDIHDDIISAQELINNQTDNT